MSLGLSSEKKPEPIAGVPRYWVLFFLLGLFPFLMRTNLDVGTAKQESFLSLYRDWRWSEAGRMIPLGSTLIFEAQEKRDVFEDMLRNQLQKDFRLVEFGEHPRIRAFFDESANRTFEKISAV